MSLSRYSLVLLLTFLIFPSISLASNGKYNYINATALEARLTANIPTNIVDIQIEEEFSQHHIKGATPTYAYPVKSDTDRAKLETIIEGIKGNNDPVVIVCPRGAGGAKRTYDYLLEEGISPERLLILEKGQEGWTCAPLTESK